jgi:hypothetical protein
MTIQTNTITFSGILCCVFWCAIFALTRLLLSVSRIWLTLTDSRITAEETHTPYNNSTSNPLNYKSI